LDRAASCAELPLLRSPLAGGRFLAAGFFDSAPFIDTRQVAGVVIARRIFRVWRDKVGRGFIVEGLHEFFNAGARFADQRLDIAGYVLDLGGLAVAGEFPVLQLADIGGIDALEATCKSNQRFE